MPTQQPRPLAQPRGLLDATLFGMANGGPGPASRDPSYFARGQIDLPPVVVNPSSVRVPRGMTAERLARNIYGDDWRAGVHAIVTANRLKRNRHGSPILTTGKTINIPDLADLDEAALASANRAGGQIVAGNSARLKENRDEQRFLQSLATSRYAGLRGDDLSAAFESQAKRYAAMDRAALQRARDVEASWRHVADRTVERSQWARPLDPTKTKPSNSGTLDHTITLHHSGRPDTPQEVEALHRGSQNWFRKPLRALGAGVQPYEGYGDVGYNYLIEKDGQIYEGRPLRYERAHVRGHNDGNIGVAALGNYSNRPMAPAQAESLRHLVNLLESRNLIRSVKTHGQLDAGKANELSGAAEQIAPLLR